ncbi:hypothetical protein FOXYSP1_20732 [Fusarium oxysporum f. sp. phaseoli]
MAHPIGPVTRQRDGKGGAGISQPLLA